MLVFKYTVKWRVRGWFFRRLHNVKSITIVGDQYLVVKQTGAQAYLPVSGCELVVGRGLTVLAVAK